MINPTMLEQWLPYVRGYIDEQLKWSALWGQTLEERAACYEEYGRRCYERGLYNERDEPQRIEEG